MAAHFGKQFLHQVSEEDFRTAIPSLRVRCEDRTVLRAIHYYDNDRRTVQETQALEAGGFDGFLALVNASGISSALHLQNTWASLTPGSRPSP